MVSNRDLSRILKGTPKQFASNFHTHKLKSTKGRALKERPAHPDNLVSNTSLQKQESNSSQPYHQYNLEQHLIDIINQFDETN